MSQYGSKRYSLVKKSKLVQGDSVTAQICSKIQNGGLLQQRNTVSTIRVCHTTFVCVAGTYVTCSVSVFYQKQVWKVNSGRRTRKHSPIVASP